MTILVIKELTWLPDLGSQCSEEPDVVVTKFGDGYESRLATNINSQPEKWSVTFTTNLVEFNGLRDFLKEHGAVKAFFWTTPMGEKKKFVCRSWTSKQIGFGVYQISSSFEQVFE